MKRSVRPMWLFNTRRVMCGLVLPRSGWAEHDFGTKMIEAYFGLEDTGPRSQLLDRCRARLMPEDLSVNLYRQDKQSSGQPDAALMMLTHWSSSSRQATPARLQHMEVELDEGSDLAAAWDGESFAVHVRGADNLQRLLDLHERMQRLDLAVTRQVQITTTDLSGNLLIEHSGKHASSAMQDTSHTIAGVCLLIPSRMRTFGEDTVLLASAQTPPARS